MDQEVKEKILKKLRKIKMLAENGVNGEKKTAMRMYEELCHKYDISDNEAEAAMMKLEKRWFSYSTKLEEQLLLQIFYKVTGDNTHYVYTGQYRRRKKRGCVCTELEATEIELLFSFYKKEMENELEAFMIAFKQKNNLYPDKTAREYKEYDGPEKELTNEELRKYKKAAFMRQFMDGNMPPKAAIEEKE